MIAVQCVNDHAGNTPNAKPNPVPGSQSCDEIKIDDDPKDWDRRPSMQDRPNRKHSENRVEAEIRNTVPVEAVGCPPITIEEVIAW